MKAAHLATRLAAVLGLPEHATDDAIVDAVQALAAHEVTEDALFMRSIFEHLPAMVFLKDATELRFVRFNRAGEELLGLSRRELLGRNDHDLFAPAQANAFTSKDREVLARGGVHDIPEEPISSPSGERWLHTKKIPIDGADGTPRYLLGISVDITEARHARVALQRAEAELRAQTAKLRLLLEHFPGAVWTTDRDLTITSVAGALAAELDLDPKTTVGADVRSRRVANAAAGEDAPAHEAALEGRTVSYELHTTHGTFDVRVEPLDTPPIGAIGVALDVTERRMAEAERLQTRLQRAQKLETLGLLAGGIAHDFNNLLASVLGNASLALLKLEPGSPARESLRRIERTAETAADLTRQMLAYSGRGRFVIEPLDLSAVVEEIAGLLRVTVAKHATLKLDVAAELPPTAADAAQIRQLVMNLLTNAADAIGPDLGIISISTFTVDADRAYLSSTYLDDDLPEGRYVALEVSDSGCGMNAETQHHMFDPFYTTKEKGHGLGLAATLGIVRGHRGAIRVYSELGRGTTVKVLLPALDISERRQVAELEVPATASGPATVLVADDEPAVRTLVKDALETFGFDVLLAKDGLECVEIYKERGHEVDAVLLDMTMPRLDGEQTFRELRRIDPAVRVLLTSGYNEVDATARFAGKGLAGFLQKPFRVAQLVAQLEALVGRTP